MCSFYYIRTLIFSIKNISFSNNTIEDILFFTEMMPRIKNIKFIKSLTSVKFEVRLYNMVFIKHW